MFHEWDSSGECQIFQKDPATYTIMTLQRLQIQNQTICLLAVQEEVLEESLILVMVSFTNR